VGKYPNNPEVKDLVGVRDFIELIANPWQAPKKSKKIVGQVRRLRFKTF
jgi:hypothetical protein